jgi:hypothetical protein
MVEARGRNGGVSSRSSSWAPLEGNEGCPGCLVVLYFDRDQLTCSEAWRRSRSQALGACRCVDHAIDDRDSVYRHLDAVISRYPERVS